MRNIYSHFSGGRLLRVILDEALAILICATHCAQDLPFQVLVYGFDSKFQLGTVLVRHVDQMRLQ